MSLPLGPQGQASEIVQGVEGLLPVDQIFPVKALLLGGLGMALIVLLHALMTRAVTSRLGRAEPGLRLKPVEWRIEMAMLGVVGGLLTAAVLEVCAWAALIKHSGVLPTWAGSSSFAAACFTALGNSWASPPEGWRMLGPIIAMSGLFSFGWSTSVFVDAVGRLNQVRDLARTAKAAARGPQDSGGKGEPSRPA